VNSYSIQQIPEEERPRERLARLGPESLSTVELIAILLGSGTKGMPILQLAQQIVKEFGGLKQLAETTLSELCQVPGVGKAKAMQLQAAFNLGLRASRQVIPPKYRIENPIHAYQLLKDEMESETREMFVAIFQDVKGFVICHQIIAIGTLSRTLVHPREVFYPAIRHKASSLIIAHNHPSGDPTPSPEDYEITRVLVEVGHLMNLPIQDHIIVGHQNYISLRQRGVKF
jgi:DNA repair protein RadC